VIALDYNCVVGLGESSSIESDFGHGGRLVLEEGQEESGWITKEAMTAIRTRLQRLRQLAITDRNNQ
jgi:hypothetical protein